MVLKSIPRGALSAECDECFQTKAYLKIGKGKRIYKSEDGKYWHNKTCGQCIADLYSFRGKPIKKPLLDTVNVEVKPAQSERKCRNCDKPCAGVSYYYCYPCYWKYDGNYCDWADVGGMVATYSRHSGAE